MSNTQDLIIEGFVFTMETYDLISQAEIYGQVISDMAKTNIDIVVLTSDLMRSNKTGTFKQFYPERFFNFGIAETNMVAAAAGMAVSGKLPYISSMAVFLSLRCAEAIRTDIAYPNLKVCMIGTHSGLSMGNGGTTHHATEDIAILRSMANMTVIVPADTIETGKAVRASENLGGPVYIRIGRSLEPLAYADDSYDYSIGKSIMMRDHGKDLTVIACGICVKGAMDAADALKNEGVNIRVINMHTVKPLDEEAVLKAARETGGIITAEEHSIIGGLGGAVAETLSDAGIGTRFKRIGVPDCYTAIGYPEDLYPRYSMDAAGIRSTVLELLRK